MCTNRECSVFFIISLKEKENGWNNEEKKSGLFFNLISDRDVSRNCFCKPARQCVYRKSGTIQQLFFSAVPGTENKL